MPQSRARKTEWQRQKRAEAAIAAGRIPHRTGRPPKPGARTRMPKQPPIVIPPLHVGHDLYEEARRMTGIARDERTRTLVRRDSLIREDGMSEAVLALLEGRDPVEAWRRFRNRELRWVYRTAPLLSEED